MFNAQRMFQRSSIPHNHLGFSNQKEESKMKENSLKMNEKKIKNK